MTMDLFARLKLFLAAAWDEAERVLSGELQRFQEEYLDCPTSILWFFFVRFVMVVVIFCRRIYSMRAMYRPMRSADRVCHRAVVRRCRKMRKLHDQQTQTKAPTGTRSTETQTIDVPVTVTRHVWQASTRFEDPLHSAHDHQRPSPADLLPLSIQTTSSGDPASPAAREEAEPSFDLGECVEASFVNFEFGSDAGSPRVGIVFQNADGIEAVAVDVSGETGDSRNGLGASQSQLALTAPTEVDQSILASENASTVLDERSTVPSNSMAIIPWEPSFHLRFINEPQRESSHTGEASRECRCAAPEVIFGRIQSNAVIEIHPMSGIERRPRWLLFTPRASASEREYRPSPVIPYRRAGMVGTWLSVLERLSYFQQLEASFLNAASPVPDSRHGSSYIRGREDNESERSSSGASSVRSLSPTVEGTTGGLSSDAEFSDLGNSVQSNESVDKSGIHSEPKFAVGDHTAESTQQCAEQLRLRKETKHEVINAVQSEVDAELNTTIEFSSLSLEQIYDVECIPISQSEPNTPDKNNVLEAKSPEPGAELYIPLLRAEWEGLNCDLAPRIEPSVEIYDNVESEKQLFVLEPDNRFLPNVGMEQLILQPAPNIDGEVMVKKQPEHESSTPAVSVVLGEQCAALRAELQSSDKVARDIVLEASQYEQEKRSILSSFETEDVTGLTLSETEPCVEEAIGVDVAQPSQLEKERSSLATGSIKRFDPTFDSEENMDVFGEERRTLPSEPDQCNLQPEEEFEMALNPEVVRDGTPQTMAPESERDTTFVQLENENYGRASGLERAPNKEVDSNIALQTLPSELQTESCILLTSVDAKDASFIHTTEPEHSIQVVISDRKARPSKPSDYPTFSSVEPGNSGEIDVACSYERVQFATSDTQSQVQPLESEMEFMSTVVFELNRAEHNVFETPLSDSKVQQSIAIDSVKPEDSQSEQAHVNQVDRNVISEESSTFELKAITSDESEGMFVHHSEQGTSDMSLESTPLEAESKEASFPTEIRSEGVLPSRVESEQCSEVSLTELSESTVVPGEQLRSLTSEFEQATNVEAIEDNESEQELISATYRESDVDYVPAPSDSRDAVGASEVSEARLSEPEVEMDPIFGAVDQYADTKCVLED